ncbi:MAG: hypothetical protein ACD_42C00528G0002 [uncultured bacterium]|nr:MAG: hypothetical protein ACD_42C00528G0002 [uncultured bacterium]OGT32556.1 MAG: hypothetical protein A3C44_02295 [Gammaproteobacteria bacterium RIFCSPHIGHO2_02_FULL_39_13]OGT48366.1 MAG: hypothetical protein A3E53_05990 [Gammaproteobacteria bacterium RIFCSPHIGHO2_12_FULL_39_24]
MIDPKNISEIIQNVLDELPPGLKNMPDELKHNFRAALHSVFEKLDLVTREEFDAQCKVLLRTREKLERLEREVRSKSEGV